MSVAGVAHPVERHLAKVEVASSSLVTRSKKDQPIGWSFSFWKGVRLESFKCNCPGEQLLISGWTEITL